MAATASRLKRIPPQSGVAFCLRAGETLVVVDVEGEQVSSLVAFGGDDPAEYISSGRTIDYASTVRLRTGQILYSNRSRPMLTIVRDDVGVHDFLLMPCSQQMLEIVYGKRESHPNCLSNLANALREFEVFEDAIPVSFNIFMNVEIAADGGLQILSPRSRAGDLVALRADMDLIIGLTACASEMSNNYVLKPVDFMIVERPAGSTGAESAVRPVSNSSVQRSLRNAESPAAIDGRHP